MRSPFDLFRCLFSSSPFARDRGQRRPARPLLEQLETRDQPAGLSSLLPMSTPLSLAFGPDGNLLVGSYGTNSVLRFTGNNGHVLAGAGLAGAAFVEPQG